MSGEDQRVHIIRVWRDNVQWALDNHEMEPGERRYNEGRVIAWTEALAMLGGRDAL